MTRRNLGRGLSFLGCSAPFAKCTKHMQKELFVPGFSPAWVRGQRQTSTRPVFRLSLHDGVLLQEHNTPLPSKFK